MCAGKTKLKNYTITWNKTHTLFRKLIAQSRSLYIFFCVIGIYLGGGNKYDAAVRSKATEDTKTKNQMDGWMNERMLWNREREF